MAQQEAIERNSPEVALPRRLLPAPSALITSIAAPSASEASACRMNRCFDYSLCALTSGFPVYLYDPEVFEQLEPDSFLRTHLAQTFGYNPHTSPDPSKYASALCRCANQFNKYFISGHVFLWFLLET